MESTPVKSIDDRNNAEAKRTTTWVIPIVLPLLCDVSLSLSDAEAIVGLLCSKKKEGER